MKTPTSWLTLILGLSLAGSSLPAQEPTDTPSDDADEESSEKADVDDSAEDIEESEASKKTTGDEESDGDTQVAEKTWQDRLVPSIAVSGLGRAPEVVVGEPSASSDDVAGDKVYLPYPPRPRSPLPPGWVLRPSEALPSITRNVTLADGRRVILEFPSMELQPAPAKDGSVSMQEPGFDPRKVSQENTISSALSQFIDDTTKHREVLGEALREMEQILLSAPAAPAAPRRAMPVSNNDEPSSPLLPSSPPSR